MGKAQRRERVLREERDVSDGDNPANTAPLGLSRLRLTMYDFAQCDAKVCFCLHCELAALFVIEMHRA